MYQSRDRTLRDIRAAVLCVMCVLASAPMHSQTHLAHQASRRLGTVHFPNSGAPAAQEPFLRGIALLHSYEYVDAREAFSAARLRDPEFALAAWCEALTHSQFDWGTEDLVAARAVLLNFAPTRAARLAMAGTPEEREFGAAIESFLDDGALLDRARGVAAAMRLWATHDPTNVEALAFAARGALYVLRYAPADERRTRAEEAIALAEQVVAVAPDHPGGWHYLIHATDSPQFAARGLAAARKYDSIAPDADHALHMPSHIFLQLGMWDDVVRSNERAWAASRAWAEAGRHSLAELGWHSLQWLQYGLLQQGRFAAAGALIDTARTLLSGTTLSGYPDLRYTVETLTFQYAMETGDWAAFPANPSDHVALLSNAESATSRREQAMVATAAYHVAAARMMQGADTAAAHVVAERFRAIAAPLPTGQPRREFLNQMATTLTALLLSARGDVGGAVAAIKGRGSEREPGVAPIGPPNALIDAELLGCWLLESKRTQDARVAYALALRERPNRWRARLGLASALRLSGDARGADSMIDSVRKDWTRSGADAAALARVTTEALLHDARPPLPAGRCH